MRRLSSLLLLVATSLAAVACGGYRVVSHSPGGGTVALEGSMDTARNKAEEYMGHQCPFGYQVVPDSVTTPGVDREWRISYRCKGADGAPVAGTSQVAVGF